eukprot:2398067-Pleurochrysis_carterae.AAC.2
MTAGLRAAEAAARSVQSRPSRRDGRALHEKRAQRPKASRSEGIGASESARMGQRGGVLACARWDCGSCEKHAKASTHTKVRPPCADTFSHTPDTTPTLALTL